MIPLRTIKIQTSRRFPFLGVYKRYIKALAHVLVRMKKSYAQHGEDAFIFDQLKYFNISTGIYVDIGANHPTDISNTYLFYRAGSHGITIEPNRELSALHKKFRGRDIVLSIGCGDENEIIKFSVSKTPVLSTFKKEELNGSDIWKEMYVPVFRLDDALKNIPFKWIYLLSIDTEGLDYQVLKGARKTLKNVYILLVEINSQSDESEFNKLIIGQGFLKIKIIGKNHIFLNSVFNTSEFKNN